MQTPDGAGEVLHVNVLRQLLKVGIRQNEKDDVEIAEYLLSDVQLLRRKRGRNRSEQSMDSDEKKQLKALEEDNGK